ncbi:MAG: GTP-binding protein [Candidatus Lokiarchaeota archaeon]|nr:GTP-binding protein [Candidatus Lokiarchaeota archaeon]
MSGYDYTWKIMMLGDDSAAKTSLTIRYISGFFLDDLKLTIGVDFYSKTTSHNGRKVKLQIWDFGGEERFRFLLHQYCKGANAALFLYDITNRSSLDHLPDWTQIIREHAGDIPIMMVGTNADLYEHRTVTREEGILAARTYNLDGYIEVSSKTGQNVEVLFDTMTEILFNRYRPNLIGANIRPRKPKVNLKFKRHKRRFPTFKVNKHITLKLENSKSNIYVGGRRFQQCKYLLLDILVDETRDYGDIESIDEAEEKLQTPLATRRKFESEITPETEFWGHCSNIQAWAKFGYDTRILHRNLAFPLLKALVDTGDPQAKKVFKEEIAKRLESGYPNVVLYLESEGYLEYLNNDELDAVLESPKFLNNMTDSILSDLPEWITDKIKKNLDRSS